MFFDELYEIRRCVARQRGFAEVRIGGQEARGSTADIGKVAAAAAGDKDLLTSAVRAFEHDYSSTALACLDGAHQAGGAGANDYNRCTPIYLVRITKPM